MLWMRVKRLVLKLLAQKLKQCERWVIKLQLGVLQWKQVYQ